MRNAFELGRQEAAIMAYLLDGWTQHRTSFFQSLIRTGKLRNVSRHLTPAEVTTSTNLPPADHSPGRLPRFSGLAGHEMSC